MPRIIPCTSTISSFEKYGQSRTAKIKSIVPHACFNQHLDVCDTFIQPHLYTCFKEREQERKRESSENANINHLEELSFYWKLLTVGSIFVKVLQNPPMKLIDRLKQILPLRGSLWLKTSSLFKLKKMLRNFWKYSSTLAILLKRFLWRKSYPLWNHSKAGIIFQFFQHKTLRLMSTT